MARPITHRPDVLVLGAGGTLGIAWLRGVLEGLSDGAGIDWRECDYFLGTSAGSVVAATLASPKGTLSPPPTADAVATFTEGDDEPVDRPWLRAARVTAAWAGAIAAPAAPAALKAIEPGGRLVRAGVLAAAPRPGRKADGLRGYLDRLETRFDGRLRVAAVDRKRGRRVMFGAPGEPRVRVTDAVMASCAVPWLFDPVEIGGREYVDGGVWSPTNLDAAPVGSGSEVLCFMPTAAVAPRRSPRGALRAATHAAALTEAQALRARGARVRLVVPDAGSAETMGSDLMDAGPSDEVRRAGIAQGRRLAGP